jgi:hypothetical protein
MLLQLHPGKWPGTITRGAYSWEKKNEYEIPLPWFMVLVVGCDPL